MKNKFNIFYILVLPILILLTWCVLTFLFRVNSIILPKPSLVLSDLILQFKSGNIVIDIGWSLLRTILGFFVGAILGIILGIAMGTWNKVHNSTIFTVDALRSIPATTLFPLFMLFLGLGLKSMVALVAFPCCWLVTINTMYGVKNSSLIRKEMGHIYRLNAIKNFFFITLPDAAPSIAASLRLSIAMSLHMAIIGEMFMGSQTGIGFRIYQAQLLLRVPEMFSLIIIAGFLGYSINQLFVYFERKVVFWGGK